MIIAIVCGVAYLIVIAFLTAMFLLGTGGAVIWISFGRWSGRGGRWLIWDRIYRWRHWPWYGWTPFCHIRWRYRKRRTHV